MRGYYTWLYRLCKATFIVFLLVRTNLIFFVPNVFKIKHSELNKHVIHNQLFTEVKIKTTAIYWDRDTGPWGCLFDCQITIITAARLLLNGEKHFC